MRKEKRERQFNFVDFLHKTAQKKSVICVKTKEGKTFELVKEKRVRVRTTQLTMREDILC